MAKHQRHHAKSKDPKVVRTLELLAKSGRGPLIPCGGYHTPKTVYNRKRLAKPMAECW